MANEQDQANLTQAIGKMAATEPNQAQKQQLTTLQARNPNYVDAAAAFNQYKNQRALQGYKKGGKVRRTGLALVHKGEKVLTKAQQKKLKPSSRTGKGR